MHIAAVKAISNTKVTHLIIQKTYIKNEQIYVHSMHIINDRLKLLRKRATQALKIMIILNPKLPNTQAHPHPPNQKAKKATQDCAT